MGSNRHLTIDDFVEKAKKVHGNKFDYSKSIYKSMMEKIEIICPIHGSFWQLANSHVNVPRGCEKCRISDLTFSKDEFIQRAREVHGDRYDYSKVVYKGKRHKIEIVCPVHGSFWTTPQTHVRCKSICSKCDDILHSARLSLTQEEFLQKAITIHGDRYDYSETVYNPNYRKIKIICKRHGVFYQPAHNHLIGCGCQKCNKSKGELKIEKWLFENKIMFESPKRFKDCKNKYPLAFDFYLPIENLLIEFDGAQHYRLVKLGTHNSTDAELKQTQMRDKIKTKYAKEKNIRLLRIPYWKEKNIEEILNKSIK